MKLVYLVFAVMLISSCSGGHRNDPANGFYFQDFEDLKYWSHEAHITDKKAKSGRYSTFADSLNVFGQALRIPYEEIKGKSTVTVEASCMLTSRDPKLAVVISLGTDQEAIIYKPYSLNREVRFLNEWETVTLSFDLPAEIPEHAYLKIYLYSPQKSTAFLDDMQVTLK